ncbi:MAG: hypothetical protein ACR2QR_01550 [Woeseiaceae bacterium]
MGTPRTGKTVYLLYAGLMLAQPALGDDVNCQSVIGEETIDDNIVIAAPCTLNGTTVEGNIRIFAGGSLTATGAIIDGNIEADTADFVAILNSEVDGKIELESMVGDLSYVRDSLVDGKLKLKKNRSRLEVQGNYIDNDLEVDKNTGGVFIGDNIIEGDLECENNSPPPIGDNNFVSGKTKDQCRDLEAPEIAEDPEPGEQPGEEPEEPPGDTDTGEPPETASEGDPPADSGNNDEPPVDVDVAVDPLPTNLTPPGQLNTGTGGGGSAGPALVSMLVAICLLRSRRRTALL